MVCFITNESDGITHIGLGKRGMRAGTDLRRLNIEDIFELNRPVSIKEVTNLTHIKFRHHIKAKVDYGGLMSAKSFEEFLNVFLKKAPETIPVLDKYTRARRLRIQKLPQWGKKSLAEQKEAVLTAMNIAGISRNEAQGGII